MEYGDISPRTAAHASKDLLERAHPHMVFELFGQAKPIPAKSTKSITWRRYEKLPSTPKALTEGVTPNGTPLTYTDVTATLVQYGDWVPLTDVIIDTHEDPVLQESIDILSEQSGEMLEKVRYGILKGGTNVFYSDGAARGSVNSPITRTLQRRITRALKRQDAMKVTKKVSSTPNYSTENVAQSYIALCHPDLESDIRNMEGFIDVKDYGSMSPYDSEIGSVEGVRYLSSTILTPWEDAGAATSTMLSSGGSNADVYPILYIAKNAYGIVPFKGKHAVTPMVVNPKPTESDPLAQRGSAGWKAYQSAAILNDAWMIRAEVAATE